MSAKKLDTEFSRQHSQVLKNMKKVKQKSSLEFGKNLLLPLISTSKVFNTESHKTEPHHLTTTEK